MPALFPLTVMAMVFGWSPSAYQQPPPRAMGFGGSIRIQIIRTPLPPPPPVIAYSRPAPATGWSEHKAARCVPLRRIAAVTVMAGDSVDLLLDDGRRLRAKLGSDCPALDFYSGIYVKPDGDGRLCAGRDWIRSRSGGQCQVQTFRALSPAR